MKMILLVQVLFGFVQNIPKKITTFQPFFLQMATWIPFIFKSSIEDFPPLCERAKIIFIAKFSSPWLKVLLLFFKPAAEKTLF